MFIGHFAVGFASKRLAPEASLGVLMTAPLFLDVLWPVFMALGIEHARIEPGATAVTPLDLYDYPYSHSLVASIVWSVLAAGAYYVLRRDRRAAWVIALGVFSHFILDFVSHRPDMPLYPGGATRIGLGLWNSIPATIAVEGSMFIAGVALYVAATRARDKIGSISFWVFVTLLVLAYASDFFSPPPPSIQAVMIVGFVSWILIPWVAWFDRHREVSFEKMRAS
jgi:membrane-bound metal-dependent hydrolase YbcI (DUF457 family)